MNQSKSSFTKMKREVVATADVLTYVLRVPIDRQETRHSMRLATVMKQAGWIKPDEKITINGKRVRGYWRNITL
jgi:hypothetical protein